MTDETLSTWSLKNDRRKRARSESKHKYNQGRFNRKAYCVGGAFGDLPAALYNLCVIGTTASEKRVKNSKETYDNGSDYDQ